MKDKKIDAVEVWKRPGVRAGSAGRWEDAAYASRGARGKEVSK
jgi:hypothetical protein